MPEDQHPIVLSRVPRNMLLGVGIALLLACIEGALWILNPAHMFGSGTPHNLSSFLANALHVPLLLILLLQLAVACILVQVTDKPLALLRYIRDVQKAQERYRTLYTPLASWPAIYETTITCYQGTPDPAVPRHAQNMSMPELAQDVGTSPAAAQAHQLILGAPGAGKTILLYLYQYIALQSAWSLIFSRDKKIPAYIPLRNYGLYLGTPNATREIPLAGTQSLLNYLNASDLPGMHHLRPFLHKLAAQGRVLFLCDGLNEVDEQHRSAVSTELAGVMGQSQNRLVLTCREVDYHQQPQLEQAVEENLVARVHINPLDDKQVRSFVERFIENQNAGETWQHTAGQVMEVINRSRLREHCTNPLIFFALMEIIDSIGVDLGKQIDTRGRFLQAFVKHLIQHQMSQPAWSNAAPAENDVLLFLSEIAATNNVNAIQLPVSARNRTLRIEDLAGALHTWLSEHPAQSLTAQDAVGTQLSTSPALHEPHSEQELARLVQFAQNAALIEISPAGILSFRHELIAEYFVAGAINRAPTKYPINPGSDHWEIGTQFITPVALWAGLLDAPVEFAGRFAALGHLEALALALVCTGVAYIPPQAANAQQLVLPPDLQEAMALVVRDAQACKALARLFTCYAEAGAQEIYQSLFPLLVVNGIDEFITLLDAEVVSGLLFKQLCDIVDNVAYEAMVKRLVRVLGRFGAVVVPRAAALSQEQPGRSARLRSAAINILGGTDAQSAVEPLINCLLDSNPLIVGRAANALIRLGPGHTFTRLVQELESRTPTSSRQQVHWTILHILERFLDETRAARQLTASQQTRLVAVLLGVSASNYALEDQQKARELLVRQGRNAEASAVGEKVVESLVQNLSSADDMLARISIKMLKEIGSAATPYLLEQLKQQAPEMMRGRIIDVLGHVRDLRALPYLLRFLDDSALVVQQQVAAALRSFAPESIPGLIDLVLYSDSEPVASRAEQILGDIGEEAVRPVIQALSPIVPGRTHLLVHELERVHNPQAIPALIALLKTPQVEPRLQVAIIRALGQFPDERVVAPLLEMLASLNTLIYEGAINALSHLEDIALDGLIAALDVEPSADSSKEQARREVEQKAPSTSRIQRALLGMPHFPGERLLQVLAQGSDAQAQHIVEVFLAKGAEAAQVMVKNLFHPDQRVQSYVRYIIGKMNGQEIVPALLEELDHPQPAWRALISELLLDHPHEAIPPLISLLDDPQRADDAEDLLLVFGLEILPSLVSGLDALNNMAQERSRRIIVTLVQQTPELVRDVVQLFNLSPPKRAHEALVNLLTNELVDLSIPALLEGLEDAHLVGDASEALVRLVKKDDARSGRVLNELLAALRMEQRRHGAEITLVEIGAKAVPGVGSLITDPDPSLAQAAQNVLCEMGAAAFSFIWAAHSDTGNRARRDAARSIFRRMHTVVIKDELVQLLQSNEPDHVSMALALLLERIHDEALQTHREPEMIPALLEYAQTHSDEPASPRIIALLLLLGGNAVLDHMTQVLYDFPNHHQRLIYAFLLLGEEAEEVLLEVLHDSDAPAVLRAEAAALLGMIAPHVDIREYARMLGEYGLWAGQSAGQASILHPDRLAISLRALGGLLAGGHWNVTELQNLRLRSKEGSVERELYDILLGWRYSPYITMLEHDLQTEQEERKKDILKFTQEMLSLHTQITDLEQQFEQLQQEHGSRGEQLESANEKVEELQQILKRTTQEKQTIQDNLQRALQEKQALRGSHQQVKQEKDELQAELDQWRQYAERLEEGLNRPQRPKKK